MKLARSRASLRQGRNDWYRIENNATSGVASVYLYDEIGYFGVTANDFIKDLQGIKQGEISVHLNTPGGEVFDGIAIYNALKSHSANVTVYVDSLAASIGSVIAMAGNRIIMAKNATMMIHDGHALCVGNAADMIETAELLDKTSDNIASIYAERAGGTLKSWRDKMRAETWFSADEAVKAGLADEIQGVTSHQSDSWDLSIFNYAGRENAPEPVIDDTPPFEFDPDMFRAALKGAFE